MSSENTEQRNNTESVETIPLNVEEIVVKEQEKEVSEEEQQSFVTNIVECLGDQDNKQKTNISPPETDIVMPSVPGSVTGPISVLSPVFPHMVI